MIELSPSAIARLLASAMREELLTIMREIFERNSFAEWLAYGPDEAAELLASPESSFTTWMASVRRTGKRPTGC